MSNQFLKLRRSAVQGKIPETSSLDLGELAINTYDGQLFLKKSGSQGEIVTVVGSTGSFTGSFIGNGAGLVDIPASGITGLNLSRIATGSITASVSNTDISASFRITSGSNTLLNVTKDGFVWIGNGSFVNQAYQLDIQGSLFARGQSVIKAQGYNESVFQIQNADGVADWVFYNNDNNPNGTRILLKVPNFSSTTPITIGGYDTSPRIPNAVIIGGGTITSHGPSSIRMGFRTNSRVGTGSVSIGTTDSPGNYSVHIGASQYVNSFLFHDSAFLIGSGESYTTANSQGILAAQSIYIGRPAYSGTFSGNTGNAVATSLNGMGAYGVSDGIGGDLYLAPGAGLGTGSSGDLIFSTYIRSGSSGIGYQTLVDRWWIKSQTGTLSNVSNPPSASLYVSGSFILNGTQFNNTSSVTSTGITTVSQLSTSSYTSCFYNYTVASASNARSGQVMTVWNGSTIRYTEVVTTDIGDTNQVIVSSSLSGGFVRLQVSASSGWTFKNISNLL
jgi:hypothetical protein